ncbi:DUF4397 domain-containing protein [Natronolimnobius sp. AArcel1]|uniref:DUF4397 domain-containing protein n=1 Tax=Natronolimnobius sp. AArcel1 TaxID=1679093 RepID=UPI0013EDDE38|nr:DUF4397 domain-containing protein [Natronolimnobius sp. AArcel1]NGM70028.1 DUF4397 domain-containing protein [Natronolimnobius sp. AArcel1]
MTLSRRSTIKTIGIVGTGTALSGTVLGVSEHEDDERDAESVPEDEDMGALRVAHFSPDAPNVDVYINDQRVLADVAYDDVSPYLEIVPGTYSLTVTAAGDPDEVVAQQQFAVEDGFYTAAAIGELGAVEEEDEYDDAEADDNYDDNHDDYDEDEADGYDDDVEDVEDDDDDDGLETGTFEILLLADRTPEEVEEDVDGEDAGQIRAVHASPDAPAVDIVDSDSLMPIFEDLEFTIPSGYAAAMAGTVTLDIYPAGEAPEPQEGTDLDPEGEAEDGETIEPDDEDDDDDDDYDDDEAEPVASVEVDVEAWQAYSVYAIGYLEPPETEGDVDDDDDRSFDVVTLLDGVTDEDDEHEDDADYDAEDEIDEEPVEDEDEEPDEEPVEEEDDDYDDDDVYDEDDEDADDDYDEDDADGYDDNDDNGEY